MNKLTQNLWKVFFSSSAVLLVLAMAQYAFYNYYWHIDRMASFLSCVVCLAIVGIGIWKVSNSENRSHSRDQFLNLISSSVSLKVFEKAATVLAVVCLSYLSLCNILMALGYGGRVLAYSLRAAGQLELAEATYQLTHHDRSITFLEWSGPLLKSEKAVPFISLQGQYLTWPEINFAYGYALLFLLIMGTSSLVLRLYALKRLRESSVLTTNE